MELNKKEVSKELIIDTTLRLIEENEGIKDVNLRGIAKEIGCAHTNLYNYFNSFDEIIWESLGLVLLKMINYVDSNIVSTDNPHTSYATRYPRGRVKRCQLARISLLKR